MVFATFLATFQFQKLSLGKYNVEYGFIFSINGMNMQRLMVI